MAGNVRQRMIEGARELLARKGLQSTSFAEVTQATDTPRGSIYHHFPGGKAELVRAALHEDCAKFSERTSALPAKTPDEFVSSMVQHWRAYLAANDFEAGCAVTAVTVAAESPEQLDQASRIFAKFIDDIRQALVSAGATEEAAEEFAPVIISAIEGVTVIARAQRDFVMYDRVVQRLVDDAKQLATV